MTAWELVQDAVGAGLVVLGAIVFAAAALGVIRFPDAYARMSAVATAGGLGVILVVVGAVVLQPGVAVVVKVVLVVALQLATSAIGSMAIARAAYLRGTPMANRDFDEISDDHDAE